MYMNLANEYQYSKLKKIKNLVRENMMHVVNNYQALTVNLFSHTQRVSVTLAIRLCPSSSA